MSSAPSEPPALSVIVTSHDYERYVGEAIASALDQHGAAGEVIVVDDGSTDGSREVIESFGERVIAIFTANRGQAAAQNTGFAASSGEAVLFLDADDLLLARRGREHPRRARRHRLWPRSTGRCRSWTPTGGAPGRSRTQSSPRAICDRRSSSAVRSATRRCPARPARATLTRAGSWRR